VLLLAAPFYPISSSYRVVEPKERAADPYRRKEGLLIKTTKEQEQCRVRSGTDNPCLRPAVVKARGVPFCEPCAREQEAYFAIGELTASSQRLDNEESLVDMLESMRQIRWRRHLAGKHEPDAA
jgi:hypothetical protein